MLLESLVKQVAVIEKMIKDMRTTMRHVSPHAVDALRKQVEEMEAVYEELMESCVLSNVDLEYLLGEHDECLRDCFRPVYTAKPIVLPKPQWDTPPPPPEPEPEPTPDPTLPTVPGVNLIVYVDTSGSMRDDLGASGNVRKALVELANRLKTESSRANIPCTVSLVWFGDATDINGDGRNTYYSIAMNKGNVADFPTSVAAPVWYRGGTGLPESGILAMKETLATTYKSGVANTLIYVTDAPSKANELGATPAQVKALFDQYKINAYGIFPLKKVPDITGIFKDEREFTKPPYNILPWADKTLRP